MRTLKRQLLYFLFTGVAVILPGAKAQGTKAVDGGPMVREKSLTADSSPIKDSQPKSDGNPKDFPVLKRQSVGLVLEGGGALGLAHIGVLRWLEENHIPVDRMAGT